MIAVEPIRSEIGSVKTHQLSRRGKLSRNKLHRTRPRSITRKNSNSSLQQLRPVPPTTSRAGTAKAGRRTSGTDVTGTSQHHAAATPMQGPSKSLPLTQGKSKTGQSNKNIKLPRLKSNGSTVDSQAQVKISKYLHEASTETTRRRTEKGRQSERVDSAEDVDKPKPKKSKSVYILEAIKPNNVLSEKEKFMRLRGRYNPQFEYDHPASEKVMKSYSLASHKLAPQALKIMEVALDRYGSYEAFEEAIAGKRLTHTEFCWLFKDFVSAEGLENQVHLNLTPDLLSRAVMTRLRSRPTMNVNSKVLREGWARGLLQHEIGTHYIRSANNRYQPWHNNRGRKRHALLPMNPTEEGLASLHSVLGRDDPCLWRSAMLYYTVYQASLLSFADLFEHLGRFIKNPEVRWDYCMRAKRGQGDTSKPGCFNKDQVYLSGALQVLRFRHEIDFHALVKMGRVAFQDVERLRREAVMADGVVAIPSFMVDLESYLQQLNEIRLKNRITDKELAEAFPTMESCER
ncbi:microtubule-associated tyrosine carboxypeptidase 1-like [Diadema antillarum]|uniref:microtubule-associated tyrosine carboxypeptidase 1-like n=1 Tax=Diadema antillarum TaxID=105358 RepID=UPI003A845EED